MRVLTAAALAAALAAPAFAASLDLGALGLKQGAALTADQRITVELDDDFGLYEARAISDDPSVKLSTSLASLTGLAASDVDFSYAVKVAGQPVVNAASGAGEAMKVDATGAAFLFRVATAGDAAMGLKTGDKLYAVVSGDFSGYAPGYYKNENARLSLYRAEAAAAPVPLPLTAPLLAAALAGLGLVARRRA